MSHTYLQHAFAAGFAFAALGFATSASAATINVHGSCSVLQALQSAETDFEVAGCDPGDGDDEILIPSGTDEVWTAAPVVITTNISLRAVGGRATVRRDVAAGFFLMFDIRGTAVVSVEDLTIADGVSDASAGCVLIGATASFSARRTVFDSCGLSPGNTANLPGGAIRSGGVLLLDSCLIRNTVGAAGDRGALRTMGGSATLINTTITGSLGPAIRQWNGVLELTHVTLSGNTEVDLRVRGGREANARNSVIQAIEGALTLNEGNLVGVDPRLAPLADNGGPSLSMTPLQGSPVLDGANSAFCEAVDQRGVARPSGDQCDIGAVEHVVVCDNGFLHPSEDCDGTQFQPQFAVCPPGYEGTPVCNATCQLGPVPDGCTAVPPDAGPDASTGGASGAGGAGASAGAGALGGSSAGGSTAGSNPGGSGGADLDAGIAGTSFVGDGSTLDGGVTKKKLDSDDCGCRTPGSKSSGGSAVGLLLALGLLHWRRRGRTAG